MSGYTGIQPVPQATRTSDEFNCTAGQTSFPTAGYSPGFVDVFLNGVKLAAVNFTATNGSDIILANGAALNDVMEVVAFTTFESAVLINLTDGGFANSVYTAAQTINGGSASG